MMQMGEGVTKKLIVSPDTALALDLPSSQTFEEWVEVGRSLASANKVLQWWIGDWWGSGSHRYGERAKVAAEGIFGRDFGSLRNLASVARAFETSRRRDTLSFTHHAEVASLDPNLADELLERAERDNWSTRDIRAEAAIVRDAPTYARLQPTDSRSVELEWSALRGAWNRARTLVRERFLGEINGTEAIE
jgi:hypothetical protein